MQRKHFFLLLAFPLLIFCLAASNPDPPSPTEDGTLPALTVIAGRGMLGSHAYPWLAELTDDIGARVTGSPQAVRAVEWGLAKMKSMGLENVHAEKFQLSHGWKRGVAEAELVAPIQRKLSIDSMGWVGSTNGSVEAELVPGNVYHLDDEMKQNAGNWANKVLLIVKKGDPPKEPNENAFAIFGNLLKKAHEAHAVAVIGGQGGSMAAGMHRTHTGAMGVDAYHDLTAGGLRAEDQQQLDRMLERGQPVRMKINVQNSVTPGPVEAANF